MSQSISSGLNEINDYFDTSGTEGFVMDESQTYLMNNIECKPSTSSIKRSRPNIQHFDSSEKRPRLYSSVDVKNYKAECSTSSFQSYSEENSATELQNPEEYDNNSLLQAEYYSEDSANAQYYSENYSDINSTQNYDYTKENCNYKGHLGLRATSF